jgi:hypothetical protein
MKQSILVTLLGYVCIAVGLCMFGPSLIVGALGIFLISVGLCLAFPSL